MLSSLLCGHDPGAFTGPESQHLPAAQSLGIQKCPGSLTDVLHTVSRDQTHQGGTGAADIGSIRLLFVKEIKDLLRTGDQLQPVGWCSRSSAAMRRFSSLPWAMEIAIRALRDRL